MKRQLCATALFALALIPDWASACWPRGAGPAPEPVYYAPVYYAPIYSGPICYPAQPIYVVPPPMVVSPPRVEPMKPKGSTLIEPARPIARPNPAPKPHTEPVRPAAGVEVPNPNPPVRPAPRIEAPPPARPEPAPAPEPKRGGLFEIPAPEPKLSPVEPSKPEPKLPPLELPKTDGAKLPPIDVPTKPDAGPKLPPLELPKDTDPKLPPLGPSGGAPAIPSPAPAPDALNPNPKGPSALPPLTLPPDTPVAPDKPVEAKSSPLTGAARELKVNVFPAAGAAGANGLRKVGFYNHTARDLSLTVEGKTVTLPAMSYLHAQLPSAFTWKCGDRAAAKETVPAGAAGMDVVIRE